VHFRLDRIVTENVTRVFAMSVRLSACISAAPTGQTFVKSYTGSFTKICRIIPNLVKIGKKSDTLHEDRRLFHIVISDIGSAKIQKETEFLCFNCKAFNVCCIVDSKICNSTKTYRNTVAFPWQHWLREYATMLRYTYTASVFYFG
jgi:hypothetical protein